MFYLRSTLKDELGHMPFDPIATTIGKVAVAPIVKPSVDFVLKQIGRRGASYAAIDTLGTADKELDEVISVLRGKASSLPTSILLKLKGVLSDRPDSFATSEAMEYIDDPRVIALIKSGARRIMRKEDIADERAQARVLHAEMFGEEGIYGETLIDDAIAFAALTLASHLTPADRQTFELIADLGSVVREGFAGVHDRFDRLEAASTTIETAALDPEPFDQVVRTGLRILRQRRMLALPGLPDDAIAFGEKVCTVHRLASSAVKAEAYREVAVLLIRAQRVSEAVAWLSKAEEQGAETTAERARIAMAEQRFGDAMLLLRDRADALSRGLLLDAIALRDGEDAALAYLAEHLRPADLTGHALQVASARMMAVGRRKDAAALLDQASDAQIDENPVILFLRARQNIARAVPPDIGERLMEHDGMVPRSADLHDDAIGRQHLASARSDLELLTVALPDLGAPDFATLVDVNLTALKLSQSDTAVRELARSEFASRFQSPAEATYLAPLAKQFGVEVDWGPLKATLAKAEKLGGYDELQMRAAFAIVMDEGDPTSIADFIGLHRERLELFSTNESVVAVQIEALAKSGKVEEARRLLDAERTNVGEATASFLETTFDELAGIDTVQARLDQFEASGSTHDLEVLAEVMRHRKDPQLGAYLAKLWRLRRQAGDAQHACEAFVNAGQEREAEAFLEEIGEEALSDAYLRTHLAWARYRQGRLAQAEAELSGLRHMGIDNENTRHLTVLLAIETGRWSELESFVQRQLLERENRPADELIVAARIGRSIGSSATMDLLRAAVAREPADARIAVQAYTIASEAGLERSPEVGEWLALAIADKERSGLVQTTDLNDVIEMMTSSRTEADRISGMINSAAVPMFMGIGALGGSQSELVIWQMAANAKETDSRRRSVIPLFAGNRMLRHDLQPKSISLDPLSILLLDRLELLETAIGAFDDVVLPSGTLHSFFEDLGKASHSQPSRVEQAKRIKDAVERGTLKICDAAAPSGPHEVDPEFSGLFSAAEDSNGYVVDTAPLHPPGRIDVSVDPAPYANRLLSPIGLVSVLRSVGTISRTAAKAAEAIVAGSGDAFTDEPALSRDRPLFLTNITVRYLSDAGLLNDLKTHAGEIYTSQETIDLADREIASGTAAHEIRQGIEHVRAALARAISDGRARVGPVRRMMDELDREERRGNRAIRMSPVVSVLRDTAGIDAFVCDDRAMNKYLETTDRNGSSVAFLTTADLLAILRKKEVIDDDAVDAARERLRRSGAGMMLVDPEEMWRAVKCSDWRVGPSAELRAIRDSIHLPLARKVLQLPEERPWLRAISLSIAYAVRNAWVETEGDEEAEIAADYLLDLLPDAAALSANDPSPDRQAWISEVTRFFVWGVAAMFDLRESRVERHRRWFRTRVEPLSEGRDPGSIEAVAKSLYLSMTEPMDIDND